MDSHGNAILTMIGRSTNFLVMELLLPYKAKGLNHKYGQKKIFRRTRMDYNPPAHAYVLYRCVSISQEGAVEKTSKFIRQYKPYISDISTITDKKIKMVQKNRRSRKKMKFSILTHEL